MKKITMLLLMACVCWQACDSVQDEALRFFLRGNGHLQEYKYEDAIRFYNEALKKDSTFAKVYVNRG
ncbi:MAG: UDP-N-acetylglucosamine-peptide N-acetylglucosaminyltransferase, partial [Thermoflexibacteraceae bacterium]